MDTIIYLYCRKQSAHLKTAESLYQIQEISFADYRLLRVGISEQLLRICEENCIGEEDRRRKETGGFFARRRRRRQRQQEQMLLADFWTQIKGDEEAYSFVCEEPMPYFAEWTFNGYFQEKWVRHLLQYVGKELTHFLILGQVPCLLEILYDMVRQMKSLKWLVPVRQFREPQQELVDILYEEYGLAVEVRLIGEEEGFQRVLPVCKFPSVILDFSETDKISTADVARGSVWLDMASSEIKRRRIEDRDTGICYFSLKKEWKQPQKALNYLDTPSKNGYNT